MLPFSRVQSVSIGPWTTHVSWVCLPSVLRASLLVSLLLLSTGYLQKPEGVPRKGWCAPTPRFGWWSRRWTGSGILDRRNAYPARGSASRARREGYWSWDSWLRHCAICGYSDRGNRVIQHGNSPQIELPRERNYGISSQNCSSQIGRS